MKNISRRDFVASLPPLALMSCYLEKADLILYNADIITVNPNQPSAEAIAISGDKIIGVGSNEDIMNLSSAYTKKINIGGKIITPGFIDAHSHPSGAGRSHLRNVDCDLRSIEEIKNAIFERSKKTPKGEWISGFKYDDTKTKEKRYINNIDLDEVSPDHPVIIFHRGGHTAYVNSLALKIAGIDEETPDPKGGNIERDPETGNLNGRLLETATYLVEKFIPNQFTRSDYQAGVKLISEMLSKSGITSVTDAGTSVKSLQSFEDSYNSGELKTRVYCMIRGYAFDEVNDSGKKTGFGDEWVKIGALKLVCDGSISERTARLSEPYIGRPDYYGIIINNEDEIFDQAIKAHLNDWQIAVHANGDVGIDITLKVFERLQKERELIQDSELNTVQ